MAALEEAVTCVVCSEVYQANTRDPLVLPCGHTFCRSCLSSIYGSHYSACPSCRENFSYLEFEELPICFSLLSLSSNYIDFQVIYTHKYTKLVGKEILSEKFLQSNECFWVNLRSEKNMLSFQGCKC